MPTLTAQPGKWYIHKEAAEIMDVSRVTIWRQLKLGQIPARRIGGRMKIPGTWLASRMSWSSPTYAYGM